MESRLYSYPRCGKSVKFTSSLTRHVNDCKILITLTSCQPSKLIAILEVNTINYPDLLSDNNNKSISSEVSNYGKEGIRSADNNNKNIKPANIDQ